MRKDTTLTIFVIVLVLGLMMAGYIVIKKSVATRPTPTQQNGVSPTPSSPSEVLTSLPQDTSAGKREEYRKFVRDLAVEGNSITLNAGCKVEPLVVKIKVQGSLAVKNQDIVVHKIDSKMDGAKLSTPITIPAKGSATLLVSDFVPPNMDPRGGVVKYECDGIVSGILYVVP